MVDPNVDDDAENEDVGDGSQHGYDYLLSMPIWNLTMEKVQKLTADRDNKQQELDELLGTSPSDLWKRDLGAFLDEWDVSEPG